MQSFGHQAFILHLLCARRLTYKDKLHRVVALATKGLNICRERQISKQNGLVRWKGSVEVCAGL